MNAPQPYDAGVGADDEPPSIDGAVRRDSPAAPSSSGDAPPTPDAAPRIAFVIEALTVGGAEQMLVGLANRCAERGWDVHVVCLTRRGELAARLRADVSVHVLDKRPRIDPRLPWRLRRLMRRLRPLAINSHLWVANFWTRASLAGAGIPVIASEHSRDSWKPRHYRLLDRCLVPFTHALVAVSEDTARFYRQEIGVREGLIRVINNGVDTARYASCDGQALRAAWAPDGEFLIGSVGRLVDAKNHGRLLDMMARLVAGGLGHARLVIVGEGPERAALERRIEALGLGARVTLTGQRDDVPDVLDALDVFVLSSDREGHPLTALEAQAAGTPVVLTDVGGSSEAIARADDARGGAGGEGDGGATRVGGLLVEPDPRALATAVRRLADHPELRAAMGAFAREHAFARFDHERTVEAYLALFRQASGDRDLPADTPRAASGG